MRGTARATPPQFVRRQLRNACKLSVLAHKVPNDLFSHAAPPDRIGFGNASEDPPVGNRCRLRPPVQETLDLIRHGNRPGVTGLAVKVHDRPVLLALLNVAHLK